jgi:hypothetical protein
MRIMLELKAFMELLGGNPNEDHEDFEMKTLERGNLTQG